VSVAESVVQGYDQRFADLAAAAPDQVALIFLPASGAVERLTRAGLDRWVGRLARRLRARGVGPGRWLVIGVPNGPLHLVLALAAWKLGATVLPLSAQMPAAEAARLVDLIDAAVIVADWPIAHPSLVASAALDQPIADESDLPIESTIPHPGKAVASGGSTGIPKIIVDPNRWESRPGAIIERLGTHVGARQNQVQLVAGPLYHNAPFSWAHYGWFEGHRLVLLDRFDAARALDAIATYRVEWAALVPTMMLRMLREQRERPRDLSSLEGIYHTAASCPPWVKEGWIELLGAERVFEAYGSTEGVGACLIRGDEWLLHRGSVGRPFDCRIEIRGSEGRPVPTGVVGEVFYQLLTPREAYRYIGAPTPTAADGFGTVGDLGWLDGDGYLHLADRRTDLIISGGSNVYPAEVEIALSAHPGVRDVVVVGLPDPEWGQRVHAIVEPVDRAPPSPDELRHWCRERLTGYKIPKTFEFVTALPRDEAGKIRRSSLRAARSGEAAATPATEPQP
jgi:bile acid-coenzyme A ligase